MPGASGEKRYVKLGRKILWNYGGVAHHWAVAVGKDESWTWYEIELPENGQGNQRGKRTKIVKNNGRTANSCAGYFGSEIVGKTRKTDTQIEDVIAEYESENPNYHLLTTNCQQFAVQFIRWLTDDVYRLKHLPDAAENTRSVGGNTISVAHNGQVYIAAHCTKFDGTVGPLSGELTFLSVEAEAITGPGLGAWADLEILKMEADLGPLVGGWLGLNVNTGVGVRGGNLDVHLLGFGGKIGADGLAIDTPVGGVRVCSVMVVLIYFMVVIWFLMR